MDGGMGEHAPTFRADGSRKPGQKTGGSSRVQRCSEANEMTDKPTFYITTAISYVNGAPHLGHAYEAITTDVLARFKRLDGYDVRFLTGTDEHGEKVEQSAAKAGKSPQAFADENAAKFEAMTNQL